MLDGGLDGIESATLKPGTGYSQSSLSSAESPRSGGSSGGPAPLRGETVTLTITKADASSPVGLALGEARDGRSIVVQGVERGSLAGMHPALKPGAQLRDRSTTRPWRLMCCWPSTCAERRRRGNCL